MVKGKTESGFEFELNEQALTDFRLLDLLSEIEDGNVSSSVKAIKFLLGDEQKEKLYDFCKNEDGFIPADEVIKVFGEIMNSCKQTKN